MIRTQKFIVALAYSPVVVTTDYVESCVREGELLNPEDYLLRDKTTEQRLGINLQESLARAKVNRRQLLKGATIYCTQSVHGGVETYKAIVEANGGVCLPFKPRQGSILSKEDARNGKKGDDNDEAGGYHAEGQENGGEGNEDNDAEGSKVTRNGKETGKRQGRASNRGDEPEGEMEEEEEVYLISGDAPDEKKVWPKFRQMVIQAGYTPRIVKTEWLLDVAMAQERRWRADYELSS